MPGPGVDDLEGGTQIAVNTFTGLALFTAFTTTIWQKLGLVPLAAFIILLIFNFILNFLKLMINVQPLWTPTSPRNDRMLVDWLDNHLSSNHARKRRGTHRVPETLQLTERLKTACFKTLFWGKSSLLWVRNVEDCGAFHCTIYFSGVFFPQGQLMSRGSLSLGFRVGFKVAGGLLVCNQLKDHYIS